MGHNHDTKSRFTILKEGKISLLVSALLVGSIVNVAHATGYTVDNNTTTQAFTLTEDSTIRVRGDLNVSDALALVVLTAGHSATIKNSANISSTSQAITIDDSLISSSITNSGTINIDSTTTAIGIRASVGSMTNSSITNNGTINSTNTGGAATGIFVGTMNGTSSMTNNGTINLASTVNGASGLFGFNMFDNSSMTNNGTINATSTSTGVSGSAKGLVAQLMDGNASMTNNGTINAMSSATGFPASGIIVRGNDMNGNSSIINNGAMNVHSATYIAAGIQTLDIHSTSSLTNSGTMNITSTDGTATGVFVRDMDGSSSITNSGTINVNSTNGNANGVLISNMKDTSSLTNSGTITATLNGAADAKVFSLNVGSMTAGSTLTNTSAGVLNGNLNVVGQMSNHGRVSLPYNANGATSASVSDFSQSTAGVLSIGLSAANGNVTNNYSTLAATTATFATGSTINVNVLSFLGNADQNLTDVVSAGTLTINGPLNMTDNSALLNFSYVQDANTIDLVMTEVSILDSVIAGGGGSNAQSSANTLMTIKNSGSTALNTVFSALNTLPTDAAVVEAVASTTPAVASSAAGAASQVMGGMQGIVGMRQSGNVGGGLNSGDDLLVDKNFWFKPYASFGTQDNKNGINGFSLNTGGFGIGIDAEYAPKQRLGLGLFFTQADVDVNNMNQNADMDVFSAIVYGNVPILDDKTNFLYQAGYSVMKTDSRRGIALTGTTASADYSGSIASLNLKLMRNYAVNDDLTLQPSVKATYSHFTNAAYTETGAGALNLHVDEFSSNEFVAGVGTIANYRVNEDSKIIANLNVNYDFNSEGETVTSSYEGAVGVKFDTKGIDNGDLSYQAGLGYEMQDILGGQLSLMYDYQTKGGSFTNNVFSAKYIVRF